MVVPSAVQARSQSPLNVVLDIVPEKAESLASLLAGMKHDPGENEVLPFAKLNNVHFARLVVFSDGREKRRWCVLPDFGDDHQFRWRLQHTLT